MDEGREGEPEAGEALGRASTTPVLAARWLAVLRVGVGLYFIKALWTKLTFHLLWGFLPYPAASQRWVNFMPKKVGEFASGNPYGWYGHFLQETVVQHAPVFANLTAFGETAVGIGLVFGFLVRPSAAVGFLMMANYFMASQWRSPGEFGFHYVLMLCMLTFAGSAAGRCWGVDGWLRGRHPGSPLSAPWMG